MDLKKQKIVEFFNKLDRAFFLEDYQTLANIDRPLPIGYDQTISQPSLVLDMTLKLQISSHHKILEIGTGSGYQTAFLAEFGDKVFTIERIKPLQLLAKHRLSNLGYTNIKYRLGDGSLGWKTEAPFDRIIVTAAVLEIPEILIQQLRKNGRMLIPVGELGDQRLQLVTKDNQSEIHIENIYPVSFVPLIID